MIKEKEYLEAKKIIDAYNEQLKQADINRQVLKIISDKDNVIKNFSTTKEEVINKLKEVQEQNIKFEEGTDLTNKKWGRERLMYFRGRKIQLAQTLQFLNKSFNLAN